MHLTQDDLKQLCSIAKKAALLAGKIIAKEQGRPIEINSKNGGENIASCVVTEVDIASEKAILEILSPTLERYDLGLLAEESSDDSSRLIKDYFWCIDPLDGTLSFSKNEDGYSTSIALVSRSGAPVIGVVFNPRTNDLYYAIKGCGAFKNDSNFCINIGSDYLTLLYDQSFLKHPRYQLEIERMRSTIDELGIKGIKHHHLGGAVLNGISTIELAPAIYYKHPKEADGGGSSWDFAASSIIQSEAGGYNSDYNNIPLNLNNKSTTFMNHNGVIFCNSKELSDKLIIRE
jgi:fructose-1,6-bisphosphatase/inositol monophosphatase family enzyme